MPNRTTIAWADYSSNPIKACHRETGKPGWACVRVSDGCRECYAATLNRRLGTGLDFTVPALSQVEPYLDERELHKMLTFRPKPIAHRLYGVEMPDSTFKNGRSRPAVFTCDMTDLFGEWVPDEWLDRIFAVFALRPDVDWLVLTKRPERMRAYICSVRSVRANTMAMADLNPEKTMEMMKRQDGIIWPPPNCWLGTSVENQHLAGLRVPELLATPAAVRFLSCEPLLGPIDLRRWLGRIQTPLADGYGGDHSPGWKSSPGVNWVIAGGESGAKARPCDIAWIRSLRDQCQPVGVPVFVKQQGANIRDRNDAGFEGDTPTAWPMGTLFESPGGVQFQGDMIHVRLRDRKGGDWSEWAEEDRVREFPLEGRDA